MTTKAKIAAPSPTACSSGKIAPGREGGCADSENNYVARRGPDSGNRKGAGARPGNRNALKTGLHTARMRAKEAAVRAQIARVKAAIALVDARLAGKMDRRALDAALAALVKQPRPEFPE